MIYFANQACQVAVNKEATVDRCSRKLDLFNAKYEMLLCLLHGCYRRIIRNDQMKQLIVFARKQKQTSSKCIFLEVKSLRYTVTTPSQEHHASINLKSLL
jgi:hypothetical protein